MHSRSLIDDSILLLLSLLHFLPIEILILPFPIFKLLPKVNLLKDFEILLHLQQFLLLLLNLRVDLLILRILYWLHRHQIQLQILIML